MGVTVQEWVTRPGHNLPVPLLADDRAQFPADVVNRVLMWLRSLQDGFTKDFTPTPITVVLVNGIDGRKKETPTRVMVEYGVGEAEKIMVGFKASTMEILLPAASFSKTILAGYHYLVARDSHNRVIVGPRLKIEQKQRIELAS